ncbi:hypothetical protein AGMMS49545_01190 [Betaproteobacteria bacterium]|nr:hypothetical protein AGMMS49545_01190 [Betaproteobacteria bacterium]
MSLNSSARRLYRNRISGCVYFHKFRGFTLIELLVVCALLASVSMLAWGAYVDVDRRAEDALASGELLRLADALRRFHADTGYWPGEGPFRLAGEGCALSADAGAINPDFTGPAGANWVTKNAWLRHAANMTLLFTPPTLCANHPLAYLQDWNASAQRGWHGPYLPLAHRHWLDIGVHTDTPTVAPKLKNLPAFAAGTAFSPGGTDYGRCNGALAGCLLSWRSLPDGELDAMSGDAGYDVSQHEFRTHARPLFFLLDAPDRRTPRVLYWGADGRFGGTNTIDPCLPNAHVANGIDDRVVCL